MPAPFNNPADLSLGLHAETSRYGQYLQSVPGGSSTLMQQSTGSSSRYGAPILPDDGFAEGGLNFALGNSPGMESSGSLAPNMCSYYNNSLGEVPLEVSPSGKSGMHMSNSEQLQQQPLKRRICGELYRDQSGGGIHYNMSYHSSGNQAQPKMEANMVDSGSETGLLSPCDLQAECDTVAGDRHSLQGSSKEHLYYSIPNTRADSAAPTQLDMTSVEYSMSSFTGKVFSEGIDMNLSALPREGESLNFDNAYYRGAGHSKRNPSGRPLTKSSFSTHQSVSSNDCNAVSQTGVFQEYHATSLSGRMLRRDQSSENIVTDNITDFLFFQQESDAYAAANEILNFTDPHRADRHAAKDSAIQEFLLDCQPACSQQQANSMLMPATDANTNCGLATDHNSVNVHEANLQKCEDELMMRDMYLSQISSGPNNAEFSQTMPDLHNGQLEEDHRNRDSQATSQDNFHDGFVQTSVSVSPNKERESATGFCLDSQRIGADLFGQQSAPQQQQQSSELRQAASIPKKRKIPEDVQEWIAKEEACSNLPKLPSSPFASVNVRDNLASSRGFGDTAPLDSSIQDDESISSSTREIRVEVRKEPLDLPKKRHRTDAVAAFSTSSNSSSPAKMASASLQFTIEDGRLIPQDEEPREHFSAEGIKLGINQVEDLSWGDRKRVEHCVANRHPTEVPYESQNQQADAVDIAEDLSAKSRGRTVSSPVTFEAPVPSPTGVSVSPGNLSESSFLETPVKCPPQSHSMTGAVPSSEEKDTSYSSRTIPIAKAYYEAELHQDRSPVGMSYFTPPNSTEKEKTQEEFFNTPSSNVSNVSDSTAEVESPVQKFLKKRLLFVQEKAADSASKSETPTPASNQVHTTTPSGLVTVSCPSDGQSEEEDTASRRAKRSLPHKKRISKRLRSPIGLPSPSLGFKVATKAQLKIARLVQLPARAAGQGTSASYRQASAAFKKPLSCQFCSEVFPSQQALSLHRSSRHPAEACPSSVAGAVLSPPLPSHVILIGSKISANSTSKPLKVVTTTNGETSRELSFICSVCGEACMDQLDFFGHLKQHYEPKPAADGEKGPADLPQSTKELEASDFTGPKNSTDCEIISVENGRVDAEKNLHTVKEQAHPANSVVRTAVVGKPNSQKTSRDTTSTAELIRPKTAKTASTGKAKLSCPVCERGFSYNRALRKHLKDVHNAPAYILDSIQVQNSLKRQKCSVCNEMIAKPLWLYHMRSHRGERNFHCKVCGKSFLQTSALSTHERLHTGERPFSCTDCGRTFRQWSDLNHHRLSIHSGIRAHKCDICGKDFSRKYSLNLHMKMHSGETSFQCPLCPKAFRASSYLQSHMRGHTGEKPFPCPTCGKAFREKKDMRKHLRRHQPDTPLLPCKEAQA